MCSNVFEEVEERFAHPSVRVHHERDEFLMHSRSRGLVLVVLISLAIRFIDGIRALLVIRTILRLYTHTTV